MTKTLIAGAIALVIFVAPQMYSQQINQRNGIQRVLLISIDGMHAVDFTNCANGISTVNHGAPYCPSLAALGKTGINYVAASTSKTVGFLPRPDGDRHRRKPGLHRRLLRCGLFPEF